MNEDQIRRLKECLLENLSKMEGSWVLAKSDYEKDFSNLIGATAEISKEYKRYWDCIWNGIHIELKKGKVWLDLVRYSEHLLKLPPHDKLEVFTLFLIYRKEKSITQSGRVIRIYGCKTDRIIEALNLDVFSAEQIIKTKESVPRTLNAQASLQETDIRQFATFCVSSPSINKMSPQTSLFEQ